MIDSANKLYASSSTFFNLKKTEVVPSNSTYAFKSLTEKANSLINDVTFAWISLTSASPKLTLQTWSNNAFEDWTFSTDFSAVMILSNAASYLAKSASEILYKLTVRFNVVPSTVPETAEFLITNFLIYDLIEETIPSTLSVSSNVYV